MLMAWWAQPCISIWIDEIVLFIQLVKMLIWVRSDASLFSFFHIFLISIVTAASSVTGRQWSKGTEKNSKLRSLSVGTYINGRPEYVPFQIWRFRLSPFSSSFIFKQRHNTTQNSTQLDNTTHFSTSPFTLHTRCLSYDVLMTYKM